MDQYIGTYKWGIPNTLTFLYGSKLTIHEDGHIHFRNNLMPSGTGIHEWYSMTDYQFNRDVPILPFLNPKRTYRITPKIETIPEETFYLEILYYNRFHELMDKIVCYPPEYTFVYPNSAYYYTIRLLNAGCNELRFDHFIISEVSDEKGSNHKV